MRAWMLSPQLIVLLGLSLSVGGLVLWPADAPDISVDQVRALPLSVTPEPRAVVSDVGQPQPPPQPTLTSELIGPKPLPLALNPIAAPPAPLPTEQPASHTVSVSDLAAPRAATQPEAAPQAAALARNTPVEAVLSFYRLVEQHDFDRAAELWTPRMRSAFPPSENITSRFGQTHQVVVERAAVVALDPRAGRATGSVMLSEVFGSPPMTRRYTGTWDLVRGDDGWLLDQPDLKLEKTT